MYSLNNNSKEKKTYNNSNDSDIENLLHQNREIVNELILENVQKIYKSVHIFEKCSQFQICARV